MRIEDILGALAFLPDDAQVTVAFKKADLARALEKRNGGPLVMTCKEASDVFGYTAERWRRWAQTGRLRGAYQERDEGSWHLPRTACEEHIAQLARRGRKPKSSLSVLPLRSARGPRKPKAAAKTAQTA